MSRSEDRRRRRKTKNSRVFYYTNFVSCVFLTCLFFFLSVTLIHLSVSLYLSPTCSFVLCLEQREIFHWAGSNRGTEKERQGEQAVGRLGRRPLLFFLRLPLTLSAVAQSKQGLQAQRGSTTCPLQLSEGTYHRHA